MPRREKLTDQLILAGYTRNNIKLVIDPVKFTEQFPNAGDVNLLIDDVLELLYQCTGYRCKESIP